MSIKGLDVILPSPHSYQLGFINSEAKRKVIRAGRRSGKTVGAAILAVAEFIKGKRVLYAAPTADQLDRFWVEVTRAMAQMIGTITLLSTVAEHDGQKMSGELLSKNETLHIIERIGTENRIRAKTAWNADTLRGDYADLLILDEFQLMNEDTWEVVGAPMLLDNNGDAVFIYTPPSLRSAGVSKARDPRHAAKLFKTALGDETGRWQTFAFTSHDNPYISKEALRELIGDMSKASYRQEILAEDDEGQLDWLVYKAFNESACKIDRFPIPKEWLVYTGHDFGGANPAALFTAQDPATGNFYEFAEYLPGGRSTYEHVEEFKKIICLPGEYGKEKPETYNVIWRTGGSHQEDEIRQGYTAHGWHIQEPKIRLVNAQVDKVVGMMELNKIFIFNDLYNRLEEIMNCLWALDENSRPMNKIKDEQKYHLCACARYLYSNFTPETVDFNKPMTKRPSFSFG